MSVRFGSLLLIAMGFLFVAVVLVASEAECRGGCVPVPCFEEGPPCEGNCTCQWVDDIAGVCG